MATVPPEGHQCSSVAVVRFHGDGLQYLKRSEFVENAVVSPS
jgi:hypothetical protein